MTDVVEMHRNPPGPGVCAACGERMAAVNGCRPALREGTARYGEEPIASPNQRCRDCGVARGSAHHLYCCIAWCTDCPGQRMTCGCDD